MSVYATAEARLNPQGLARWRTGHPWIYRAGVESVQEQTGAEALARVVDPRGRALGTATLSRESQITLRTLVRGEEPVTRDLLRRRLSQALDFRRRLTPSRDAGRLVFGESDGLPGLIVDRYGEHLVVQFLSWGMDALREEILALLEELLAPASILARNDPAVRTLEGLPREVVSLRGETPPSVTFHEGKSTFTADLRGGQKTGAFLDQQDNHLLVGSLARGQVLDVFSYAGGFALAAARKAERVTAVESSPASAALIRAHAERNELANVRVEEVNAFDFLKQEDQRHAAYDMVILDPPAFAKNKRELEGALRGYKEINLRAMKLLKPGGILLTCSCSYHLTEPLMEEVLTHAAVDAHRTFRVLERRHQAADHPVLLGFPESFYLKCQVLERVE